MKLRTAITYDFYYRESTFTLRTYVFKKPTQSARGVADGGIWGVPTPALFIIGGSIPSKIRVFRSFLEQLLKMCFLCVRGNKILGNGSLGDDPDPPPPPHSKIGGDAAADRYLP